ncbi:RHS repeat-associated core domain-containing protein [Streptomyces sp. NBC_00448]|uniref:RHS repeat-associated core domain-containing protein n=1 Tax=Streptomyces sp. NBC_00448 TaxID=2903652 RepID=UPI002E21E50B
MSSLDAEFGGDAASRSRLVELPSCALTTPGSPECARQTPVESHYDPATHRLVADVVVPAGSGTTAGSSAPASENVVLTADTTPAGGGGTYAATSLNPSSGWTSGSSNGGFTYSYPIQVPPSIGGGTPAVALSYDSSSVDGLTSSTNAQASWIGDGWDYSPGYIERSYKSCDKDGIAGSSDVCWGGYNATILLGGESSQLVRDDKTGTWRLRDDNGSKVEFLTGASNGTSNGEYVKVSTSSGAAYYFGLNHLPGGDQSDPATNSAWTEPVYSPNSGDPCYDKTKGDASWCQMAWRLNLDYAVDAHGNLTTYTYQAETNYYERGAGQNNGNGAPTSYVRGGTLKTIDYGQRLADQVAAKGALMPADRVAFTPAPEGRCSVAGGFTCLGATLGASNAAHWPDVPYDENCDKGSTTCKNYGVEFWTTTRLQTITTQVASAGKWKDVDSYQLNQSFPDPYDGNKPSMWLDSIERTGKDGATDQQMPKVSFEWQELPNRVDGTNLIPAPTIFNRPRMKTITTETGEQIQVVFRPAACSRISGKMPASAATDTMPCYNVKWYPPGRDEAEGPESDWFNRYQVDSVTENDKVADSPAVVTHYDYGPAAWHYDDSELTDSATRTWSDFRGYAYVTATTGSGQDGPESQTKTVYYLGMEGDRNASGGSRSVSLTDSLGDHVTDSDWLAGQTLETDTYDKAGGSIATYQVNTSSQPVTTATHARGSDLPDLVARYDSTASVQTTRGLKADGTWRTATTTTRTDPSHGNLAVSVDAKADGEPEQCTLTSYATSANPLLTTLVDEKKVISGTGACTATATKDNTVSDSRSLYDAKGFGSAAASGNISSAQELDHYDDSGTPVYVTTSATTYDDYGRVVSATDPNATDTQHPHGATTTTEYDAAHTGELPTTITVKSPAPGSTTDWQAITTMDPARGLPLTSKDINGNTATEEYDPLGRLVKVWAPGRTTADHPNITYTYAVNGTDAPSAVTTSTLSVDAGARYTQSVQIFDGFGRPRQTQATPGISAYHGRVLTDTLYDSHGRPLETHSPYYDDSAPPGSTLFAVDDDEVPGETATIYDGQDRSVASVFSAYAQEQWRTATAYPGVDETDTTPPAGGTPTTVITDAAGRTTQAWQYKTSTATGKSSDADVTTYTYTPAGNPDTQTDSTTKDTWSYRYDQRGRPTSQTDPDMGTTTKSYDADGRLAATTDARKITLSYDYDLLGRQTAEYSTTAPSTTKVPEATWTYDTAPGGKGQPAESNSYTGGDTAHPYSSTVLGYDIGGRSTGTSVTIPSTEGKLAGTYKTQAIYDPITGNVSATHTDARGDLPAETLNYSYDVNGALLSYGSTATEYDLSTDYDAFGRPVRTTVNPWGTEIVATDNYDQSTGNLLSSYLDKQSAGTGAVQQITYTRDPAGKLTAIQNIADNTPSLTDLQCFSYDYLGRLTTAWTDNGGVSTEPQPKVSGLGSCKNNSPTSGAATGKTTVGGPAPYWTSYSYDETGNRTGQVQHDISGDTAKDISTTQAFAIGRQNTPTTAANSGGGTGGPHALLSTTSTGPGNPGTSAFQYDAVGDTTAVTDTSGTTTLTWDTEGRLASDTKTGTSGGTTYVYDADGNQLLRHDPGKTTLNLGDDELVLDTATGSVTDTRTYSLPNGLTAVVQAGSRTWQVADDQGTATLALDATTLTESRRPADPFGVPRGTQPTSWAGDHGFVGGTKDDATGLTNLGAREYQPLTGRFLDPDPLLDPSDPQQWNGYAYGANDPVNQSDPTGQRSECGQNGDAPCNPASTSATGGSSGKSWPCNIASVCAPAAKCDRTCLDMGKSDPLTKSGYTEIYPNVVIRNDTKDFSRFRAEFYKMIQQDCIDGSYNCYDPTAHLGEPPAAAQVMGWLARLEQIEYLVKVDLKIPTLADVVEDILATKAVETVAKMLGPDAGISDIEEAQANLGRDEAETLAGKEGEGCVTVNSFPGETKVLSADGNSERIDHVKVGDKVVATNPLTGKTQPEKVTAVIKTLTDTDFTDVGIANHTITSTQHHPYWDVALHRWANAADLHPGDLLRLPDGTTTRIHTVRNYTGHTVTL